MPILVRLVDMWIGRKGLDAEAEAARRAVAHLKPAVAVTGASRGIGLALASRFADLGFAVVAVARDETALCALRQSIEERTGSRIVTVAQDVTAPGAAETIERAATAAGFYIDILVNNAGIGLAGAFEAAPEAEIDRLVVVNIAALTRLTRHFLPSMRRRRRGGILNMASLGGAVPGPNQAAYYASKAYVLSLSEALAQECAGEGVRVAAVAPGPVDTRFHADMAAEGSPYRLLIPALNPKRTARAAIRGYQLGQRVVVPGLVNRAVYISVRALPHPLTVPVVGWLLAKPEK